MKMKNLERLKIVKTQTHLIFKNFFEKKLCFEQQLFF